MRRAVRGPGKAAALAVLIKGEDGVSLVLHRHLGAGLGNGLVVAQQIGPLRRQAVQGRMAGGVHLQVDALRVLLPVIIALAYELNRWAGRHDENIVSRIVTWPGKQLQHLTTNEPDDGMIECAIRAMELVIPEEKGKDAW